MATNHFVDHLEYLVKLSSIIAKCQKYMSDHGDVEVVVTLKPIAVIVPKTPRLKQYVPGVKIKRKI